MTDVEKKQRERQQKLINGNIPNFSVQLSYEGKPKKEDERESQLKQFIARVNLRRKTRRKCKKEKGRPLAESGRGTKINGITVDLTN